MKKTFALVLAVAMVMSLAAVSFAAPQDRPVGAAITAANSTVKENSKLTLKGPYRYDSDTNSMLEKVVQYGKAAYWQVLYNGNAVTDYNDVEKLKIKAKWEMGSDLVESLSIVKKNVGGNATTNSYAYYVELKTKANFSTSDSDIIGTLTFNMKKNKDASPAFVDYEFDDADFDITLNVFVENNWLDSASSFEIDDDFNNVLKPETKYLLKFNSDDEVDLEFGLGQNEGTFTVDVSGQGKVILEFNTLAVEALAAANPSAKMFFVNFNDTKFNRTGELAYEWEDGKYAYQIIDGKLKAIGEYDDADECFYINTRVLGSYVFSDVELVDAAPAVTAPTETPVVNPGTGAAA